MTAKNADHAFWFLDFLDNNSSDQNLQTTSRDIVRNIHNLTILLTQCYVFCTIVCAIVGIC
jgi:hypothetical protein